MIRAIQIPIIWICILCLAGCMSKSGDASPFVTSYENRGYVILSVANDSMAMSLRCSESTEYLTANVEELTFSSSQAQARTALVSNFVEVIHIANQECMRIKSKPLKWLRLQFETAPTIIRDDVVHELRRNLKHMSGKASIPPDGPEHLDMDRFRDALLAAYHNAIVWELFRDMILGRGLVAELSPCDHMEFRDECVGLSWSEIAALPDCGISANAGIIVVLRVSQCQSEKTEKSHSPVAENQDQSR